MLLNHTGQHRIAIFLACLSIVLSIFFWTEGSVKSQQPPPAVPTAEVTPNISVNSVPSAVTNEELVAHFEATTAQVLSTLNTVAILIGILGGASGIISAIFSFSGWKDSANLKQEAISLKTELEELNKEIKRLKEELKAAYKDNIYTKSIAIYTLEARSSDPEVRFRAAQKIGEVQDIYALSVLDDLLTKDQDANVRREAAFGIREFSALNAKDKELSIKALDLILKGITDKNDEVRLEVINAFGSLARRNMAMPSNVENVLRTLSNHQELDNIKQAVNHALECIEAQRVGHYKQNNLPRRKY